MFPVGAIFITTANYSAASNGAAVSTALGLASTVQWQRFGQGRAIVGADIDGLAISAGAITNNVATFTIPSGHSLSVGDSVTISDVGFSGTSPNGSKTVTTVSSTSFSISLTGADETFSGFTDAKVINNAFDAGDTGGASHHVLVQAEMNHNHQWYKGDNTGSGQRQIELDDSGGSGSGSSTFDDSADEVDFTDARVTGDKYTDNNRAISTGAVVTAHNNLQPYITTYIWKRTA